jgi:hypothetical protein
MKTKKILALFAIFALIIPFAVLSVAQEVLTPTSHTRNIIDLSGNPIWTPSDAINAKLGDNLKGTNTAGYLVIVVFKTATNDTIPPIHSIPHTGAYEIQIPGEATQVCVKKDGTLGPGTCLAISFGSHSYGPSLSTVGIFILIGLLLITTIYIYNRKKMESAG